MITMKELEAPVRQWVPDWLGLISIFVVILPVTMLNGSYTGSMLEVSNTLGTNSEDITMGYYAASAGMAIAYPIIPKVLAAFSVKSLLLIDLVLQFFLSWVCARTQNADILIVCSFAVRSGDRLKERKDLSHSDHSRDRGWNSPCFCRKQQVVGGAAFGDSGVYRGWIIYPAVCGDMRGLLPVFPVPDHRRGGYQAYGSSHWISGSLGWHACNWSWNGLCCRSGVLPDDQAGNCLVPPEAGRQICGGDGN